MSSMMSEKNLIKRIEDTLSTDVDWCQSSAFLVAGKWALKVRQYQSHPEEQQKLQMAIKHQWYWIRMMKNLPEREEVDPKEILQETIGQLEKR